MVHPYLQFRLRMARYGLRQFLASLANSLEITLLGFGPVLIGLAAAIALPGMMAVTLGWPAMLAILAAQALFAALPTVLLRKRLHPADAVVWARPLPVPPALAWAADALSAGLIAGPLAGLYAVSAMIWLYQWPDWLRPVAPQAIAATLLSLLLGWALATLALARRRLRAALPARRRARAAAATQPPRRWRPAPRLPRWRRATRRAPCGRCCRRCGTGCSGCRSGALKTTSASNSACCWPARWAAPPPGCWGRRSGCRCPARPWAAWLRPC